jgi:hypothetical protein
MLVQTYLGNIMKYCKLCSRITICSTHFTSQIFHVLNHSVPLPPPPPQHHHHHQKAMLTQLSGQTEKQASVCIHPYNISKPSNNITLSV